MTQLQHNTKTYYQKKILKTKTNDISVTDYTAVWNSFSMENKNKWKQMESSGRKTTLTTSKTHFDIAMLLQLACVKHCS